MKSAYLLIAHGSREKQGNLAFEKLVDEFRRMNPDRDVEGAYLELVKPSIPEGIDKCVGRGVTEIFVLPLMLFPGRHVKDDIPNFIQKAKAKHPEVDFHYAGPLCEHPMMLKLLQEKANQVKGGPDLGEKKPKNAP